MMDIKAAATSGLRYVEQWLSDSLGGGSESHSGVRVNVRSALGYPPVWYSVNKIGGHLGQLPLSCKVRTQGGSKNATSHPAYRLMKRSPNRHQTPINFKETMMAHALLMGSGRSAIIRDDMGRPIELLPLLPDRTRTVLHEGQKWHITSIDIHDALVDHVPKDQNVTYYKIPDEDVLHVPGLSMNGVEGLTLIDVARESFGLGLAAQKATSRNFKNNARPGVILEAPVGMFRNEEDAKETLDAFNESHAGLDESGKAALLRDGMTIKTVPISAKDAEWLDQRKFERQDAALLFLLESILGDDSSVSYNSLEQKNLAYLSNCLMRWIVKWEQECDKKLLTERQKRLDTHFFKFNVSALLRADSKTQMITMTGYLKNRVYSPNEVRAKLDELPYDGGDEYANPAITPGSGSEPGQGEPGADESDGERIKEESAIKLAKQAMNARVSHMIGIECKRVNDAAKNQKNFNDWVDRFYEGWVTNFTSMLVEIGGDESLASIHCDHSRDSLIELTGRVTVSDLTDAVSSMMETWAVRSEEITEAILSLEKERNDANV